MTRRFPEFKSQPSHLLFTIIWLKSRETTGSNAEALFLFEQIYSNTVFTFCVKSVFLTPIGCVMGEYILLKEYLFACLKHADDRR
jgi:hypothetical protein